jgi:hypothetical protein
MSEHLIPNRRDTQNRLVTSVLCPYFIPVVMPVLNWVEIILSPSRAWAIR